MGILKPSWVIAYVILLVVGLLKFLSINKTLGWLVFLFVYFAAMLILIFRYFPEKKKNFSIKGKTALLLFIIIIVGIILKLHSVNEPLNTTETEWQYKHMSLNSITMQEITLYGDHPILTTFFLNIVLLLLGISTSGVVIYGLLIYILTSLAIFYVSKDIFKKDLESLIAVVVFSLLPQTFIYYTTAEAETLGALLLIITAWMVWKSLEEEKYLLPAALTFALAISAKVELIIYLLPFTIVYYLFNKKRLWTKRKIDAITTFLFAGLPGYLYLLDQRAFKNILNRLFPNIVKFYTEEVPSDYTIKANIILFFQNLFNITKHPLVFFVFFSASFIDFKQNKKELLFLSSILVTYAVIYGLFIFGYQFRYIVMIYPVVCLMIGHGLLNMHAWLKKRIAINPQIILVILLIVLILLSGLPKTLKGKTISMENMDSSLKPAKEFITNDTIIVCEPFLACQFEFFPHKITTGVLKSKKTVLCIDYVNTKNYCERYYNQFEKNKIVFKNDIYTGVLFLVPK